MRYKLGPVISVVIFGLQLGWCQTFSISGYETLTGPGEARLILTTSTLDQGWVNQTLRVEISGAMVGVLIFPKVEAQTDLGYFDLQAGNYTLDVYILEKFGATVEQSGSIAFHQSIQFSIPHEPEPPEPDEPIIDPVNLGFMITSLFIFGLVLAIWRTTERSSPETSHTSEET